MTLHEAMQKHYEEQRQRHDEARRAELLAWRRPRRRGARRPGGPDAHRRPRDVPPASPHRRPRAGRVEAYRRRRDIARRVQAGEDVPAALVDGFGPPAA